MGRYRIDQVGLDRADLERLTDLWTEALGYEVQQHGPGEWAILRDPDRRDPRLFLQKVPERKVGKNRMHMDVAVPEEAEAVDRLLRLGATWLWRTDFGTHFLTVLADPEGNEFYVGTLNPDDPPP
jgi:hypothetical protein